MATTTKYRLRFWMDRRHVSAKMLARMIGYSYYSINRWMSDEAEPGIMAMRRVAAALICSVSDIWPHIKEQVDWEFRYQLITERLGQLSYRDNAEEFASLCEERNWVSVKIWIAAHGRAQSTCKDSDGWDSKPLGIESYGRVPTQENHTFTNQ